jgi:ribosomal protein S18 acetylase RimI-like enzyme
MDEFFKICKEQNIQEIKLGVYNKNEVARKFYKKYGFEEQAQRMSFKINN